jgi:hypothetical protein
MKARRRLKLVVGLLCLWLGLLAQPRLGEAAEALPQSDRLTAVQPELQRLVDDAAREGLPANLLVGKVREGLAKGASADLIVSAVTRLARNLSEANQFLRAQRRRGASAALIQALADARAGGVGWDAALPLVRANTEEARLVRGLEVLAELVMRGYPERPAGQVIHDVLERDPNAVGHLVAGLESIRRAQTVSRADALDDLGRSMLASNGSLDAAVNRSLEGKEHGAAASNGKNGQGNEHAAAAATKKGLGKGLK